MAFCRAAIVFAAVLMATHAAPAQQSEPDDTAVAPASRRWEHGRDARATTPTLGPPPLPGVGDTAGDLAHGRRLLEDVRDNVFSFDDPAFYWFCRYVKEHADPADFEITEAASPTPWKFLMERPSDYRGQLVVIEGVLMSRPTFDVSGFGREGLGRLHQCELAEVGTRSLCAVITIDEPTDIPIRSRVRAKGYFIKVRGYQTNAGESGAGPLLVALRLESAQPSSFTAKDLTDGRLGGHTWVIVGTALLAVFWLVLRRSTRRATPGKAKRPWSAAEQTTSDQDFDWLTKSHASEEPGDSPKE